VEEPVISICYKKTRFQKIEQIGKYPRIREKWDLSLGLPLGTIQTFGFTSRCIEGHGLCRIHQLYFQFSECTSDARAEVRKRAERMDPISMGIAYRVVKEKRGHSVTNWSMRTLPKRCRNVGCDSLLSDVPICLQNLTIWILSFFVKFFIFDVGN
jgi:hypothetical protein